MAALTTSRLKLPRPTGTDTFDVAADLRGIVDKLDQAVTYDEGLATARPASTSGTPGIKGRQFRRTDAGHLLLDFDLGTSWAELPYGEPWHVVGAAGEPAFQSSLTNFGAPWDTVAFRKVGDVVYLRGLAKFTGSQATNPVIFTLPVGYRPSGDRMFACVGLAGPQFVRVEVSPSGPVLAAGTFNTGQYVSLNLALPL